MMLEAARRRMYYRVFGADRALEGSVVAGAVVADIGCSTGTGSPLLEGHPTVVGVDIHLESLRSAVRSGRRTAGVNADIRALPFRSGAFDVVTALDVIEHLEPSDGAGFLAELRRIGNEVIVMTPSGFDPQAPTPGQPWMEHRSGWSAVEFEQSGFVVRGHGGPRSMRVPGAKGRFRIRYVGPIVAALLSPLYRRRPASAFHLLAVSSREAEPDLRL